MPRKYNMFVMYKLINDILHIFNDGWFIDLNVTIKSNVDD